MSAPVSIVDLFSGPGGLGEGFAAVRTSANAAYKIEISIEKEESAHATLRLRSFLRRFPALPAEYLAWLRKGGPQPNWADHHPAEWAAASQEACHMALGTPEAADLLEQRIRMLETAGQHKTLLIGGPPCQAYSLAGRSRNAGIPDYEAILDHRNFLYEEYVRVLNRLNPVAFVMENVKGMLSSSIEGRAIFTSVTQDLKAAGDGYRLFALSPETLLEGEPGPRDFIVRTELHGVPQSRHRVIIIGIRSDIAAQLPAELVPRLKRARAQVTVEETIGHLPQLRSGLSRADSAEAWVRAMQEAIDAVEVALPKTEASRSGDFRALLTEVRARLSEVAQHGRSAARTVSNATDLPPALREWLSGRFQGVLTLHDTRGHMPSDLARYLFAACHAHIEGVSPRAHAFPKALAPDHRSWTSGKFNDRFRVQLARQPSTTITSHISKDGHYFIHHDPFQCRSLTVREAARLQTFPDDYLFLGNRTQQYVQVGNAVPPWLAHQIAKALLPIYERL